ncbi:MAG TPA: MaoC family dehydratase, partial [Dongiaceae bacterium]
MMKTNPGNFFEDFHLGQEIVHAVPRTITTGDVALYTGLTGSRFAVPCADSLAQSIGLAQAGGLAQAPIDDLLLFHMVFGRTVADISLNAIANLGYANCKFGVPAFPGDTVSARSSVIGLKENSNGESGVVYVHSVGRNQRQEVVLDYVRWVMVRKRDRTSPAPEAKVPILPGEVAASDFVLPTGLDLTRYDAALIGQPHLWDDYEIGERIDHVDGMTLEESDHMTATRLYQNNAKVHFNQHSEAKGRFGRRLIYGGHIISLARALSFNGLAPAFK